MPLGTEVGLGPDDLVLDWDSGTLSPERGQSPLPQLSTHVYCGQTAGYITMRLGTEVGVSPGDFVIDRDPALSPITWRSPPPNFRPMSIAAKWLDRSRCHLLRWSASAHATCVRWGLSSPPKDTSLPQFSAHIYCGQTVVCIRIPLGTEVGLSLGDIVLDGVPAPLP